MKSYLILILLCMELLTGSLKAANPKFFVVTQSKSNTTEVVFAMQIFEHGLYKELRRAFTCIDYMDQNSLSQLLQFERTRQLLGTGSQEELQNIAGAVGCDYLVILSVNVIGKQIIMNASCGDMRKAKILAVANASGTIDQAAENSKKIVNDIVKQLEEYEICFYTGPVNVVAKIERDEYSNTSTPCDAGIIITDVSVKSKSTLSWKLNKVAMMQTSGSVTYDLNEFYKSKIINPCYICGNGTKGSATITETKESEAKIEGLSNESIFEGKPVSDARIKIVFLENGTYTLLVKATSEKGTLKVTTEKKEYGTCNAANESEPKDTKTKRMDIPITIVFGPYQGTAEDKVLQQKETIDISQGQEKGTLTIDFRLTRD